MTRRRLKSLNINFDPNFTTVEQIENIPNLKDMIYAELYHAINSADKNDKEVSTLFEINNSGNVLELTKEGWKAALEEAIHHYEKSENFEKCALYKKLIEQINEQRVRKNIPSSKQYTKRKNTSKKEKVEKASGGEGDVH